MKNKLIAIESGGDWFDANVDYLIMLSDIDPDELYIKYRSLTQYRWEIRTDSGEFMSFSKWLIIEGYARNTDENDITVINDD